MKTRENTNHKLNQLEKISLLILDDFGLAPMDHNAKLALLRILEDRPNNMVVTFIDNM